MKQGIVRQAQAVDIESLIAQLQTRCVDSAGCYQRQHEQGGACPQFWPERLQYWCRSCLVMAAVEEVTAGLAVKRLIVGNESWQVLLALVHALLSGKENAEDRVTAAQAKADALAKELEKAKELLETRGVEGQPRRIEPTGSTATGNEVPVSDSDDCPDCGHALSCHSSAGCSVLVGRARCQCAMPPIAAELLPKLGPIPKVKRSPHDPEA